jgi:multidrug efflux pump subunit AcrA (membrane-fusion protein)
MNADFPLDRSTGRPAARAWRPSRNLLLVLAAALLAAAAYTAYQRFAVAPEVAPALQTTQAQTGSLVSTVITNGSVVATKVSKLTFTTEGKLVELNVAVGDSVKAGQTLARLDTATLESKIIAAESSLTIAQLNLEKLKAGATPEELEAARIAYELASVRYRDTAAGATESDLQAGRSAVEQGNSGLVSALAKLETLEAGPTAAEMASAQAAVDSARSSLASAEAKLEDLRAGATQTDLGSAQAAVESALTALKTAQSKLETLLAGPTQVELATAQASVDQARSSMLAAADRLEMARGGNLKDAGVSSVAAAEASYNSARANYESALQKLEDLRSGALPIDIQSAESAVTTAQANHDSAVNKLEQLRRGATSSELASAESAVKQARASLANAEAQLEKLQAGPTEADLIAARSAVEQARSSLATSQAKLNDLLAGPRDSDLLSARSSLISARDQLNTKTTIKETDLIQQTEQVRQAEVNLEQLRKDLANATIVAPFDGVVSAAAAVGDQVGASTAVVTLMDPTALRVEVTVDETDVANLAAGQNASMTFDALPDLRLQGRVTSVAPMGTTTQGVVNYPVSVSIDLSRRMVTMGAEPSGQLGLPGGQTLDPSQAEAMRGQMRERSAAAGGQAPGGLPGSGLGQRAPSAGEATGRAAAAQPPMRNPSPGMSATVTIETQRKDNVLLVPNRAVRTQGRERVVEVMVGESTEMRQVQVGSANEQFTEIVSGLQEGDTVVIPVTSTTAPRTNFGVPGTGGGGMGVPSGGVRIVR